jgi:predicted FMN-binding regulatory protein PaiB
VVYVPQHFAETGTAAMHRLLRTFPLGTLVTLGAEGLAANHIPFVLDAGAGAYGRLLGHVARSNAVWRDHDLDMEALVVFQPVEAYITPNWYATKRETHEVVPTWNYAVVHVYGQIIVHDDGKWVRGQAGMLTKQQEASQKALENGRCSAGIYRGQPGADRRHRDPHLAPRRQVQGQPEQARRRPRGRDRRAARNWRPR